MKKIINVSGEIYTDPNTQVQTANGWIPAIPMKYEGTAVEKLQHTMGQHFTFGQPYCVVCLKKETTTQL